MVPPVALGDLSTDEQPQPVSADPALQRPCRATNSSTRSIARLVRVSAAWVKQADIIDGTRRVTTNLTTKREDRWRKQAICAEHIADSGTSERPRVFQRYSDAQTPNTRSTTHYRRIKAHAIERQRRIHVLLIL